MLRNISRFNIDTLNEIENALCTMLVDSMRNTPNEDNIKKLARITRVTDVYNLRETSAPHVEKILSECESDDTLLELMLDKGLNPEYVCSEIAKSMTEIDIKLKRINQVIDYVVRNNLQGKYFSNAVLWKILSTIDYSDDGYKGHGLKILKLLDQKGISLHIENGNEFNYDGPDAKEVFLLLLKHGTDKDFLLKRACHCENNVELIKYLINNLGAKWNDKEEKESILDYLCRDGNISLDLLRFLIEDLKIPTNTKDSCNKQTMLDNILKCNDSENIQQCVYYMLSIDAPLTLKTPISKDPLLVFFGKVSKDGIDPNVFESMLVKHLKQVIGDICDGRTVGREVFQPDLVEPVWDPDQINFSKVPLNYFLDAIYLFWNGSYKESHPYYQKVVDLYGKKAGIKGDISKYTMQEIKINLKTISTLLHWSPAERQMLGDEAERDAKRIKTTKLV